jgi:hypothetical protein
MRRIGTVIVFAPEVTEQQAKAALEKIKEVLDPNYYVGNDPIPPIETFNDEHGGPVFYIP